jgi:hypothetical protein
VLDRTPGSCYPIVHASLEKQSSCPKDAQPL